MSRSRSRSRVELKRELVETRGGRRWKMDSGERGGEPRPYFQNQDWFEYCRILRSSLGVVSCEESGLQVEMEK